MTSDARQLSKVNEIYPMLVNIPNGQSSIASKKGMMKFSSTITLGDVLFVLDLS